MTRGGGVCRPLGPDFHRLLAVAVLGNTADGVRLAAGPLLVASLTRDPALVGGAVFVQQLPWLLFSLPVGAYVDRLDRRRLVVGVNVLRALLASLLAAAVETGFASIVLLYGILFAVGVAEVIADNTTSALLPSVVDAPNLPRANARLTRAFLVGNQLAGPPVGAWLFVVGAALPFSIEAGAFALCIPLLLGLRLTARADVVAEFRRQGWLRRDVREGLQWLWHSRAVRLLAVLLAAMNVTFMAAFAVWVLYAHQRLGLTGAGFGLLLTASSVGGLLGTAVTGRLTDRYGPAALLRAGLIIETAVHLVLALTRNAWVAGTTMAVFGAHAAVWGVVAVTVRQRLVPDHLRGRVASVYFFLTMGGAALGAIAGGLVGKALGLTAPFWIAAAGNTLLMLAVWRHLTAATFSTTGRPRRDTADPPAG
jgi:MFS family permease